jgi:hypothetical protein
MVHLMTVESMVAWEDREVLCSTRSCIQHEDDSYVIRFLKQKCSTVTVMTPPCQFVFFGLRPSSHLQGVFGRKHGYGTRNQQRISAARSRFVSSSQVTVLRMPRQEIVTQQM